MQLHVAARCPQPTNIRRHPVGLVPRATVIYNDSDSQKSFTKRHDRQSTRRRRLVLVETIPLIWSLVPPSLVGLVLNWARQMPALQPTHTPVVIFPIYAAEFAISRRRNSQPMCFFSAAATTPNTWHRIKWSMSIRPWSKRRWHLLC